MKRLITFVFLLLCLHVAQSLAGPLTVGACYTVCNAAVCACYASAGLVFGTQPVGWWAAIWGLPAAAAKCSAAQGVCMAACTALVVAPTP